MQKLFTKEEQEIIAQSNNPEEMTWRLWSMKEAAYKIYNRETGIRAFMPLSLRCNVEDVIHGKVSCNGNTYFTKTSITENSIHTVAVCSVDDFSFIYEPPVAGVGKDNMELPYAKSGNGLLYPASISHHGRALKIVALRKAMPIIA
jgi:phosphopantetheinyl transferase (holo-ACP synthase)